MGGRVKFSHTPPQFDITDKRGVEEMERDLISLGYQPVIKDWEDPTLSSTVRV